MARETYGLLEAAIRCREWLPRLRHDGQRLVLCALVMFSDKRGVAEPSAPQLGSLVARTPRSVRRIFDELETLGAIQRVGTRPVYGPEGTARGGSIPQWVITPIGHLDDLLASVDNQTHPDTKPAPLGHKTPPTRTPSPPPLNVESLNELSIYQKYEHLRREGLSASQALTEVSHTNNKTDQAMANLNAAGIHFDIIEDL